MLVYAGIDEAGYGPMFGPLTLGRAVFAVREGAGDGDVAPADDDLDLWKRLHGAVCKEAARRSGKIHVNDSKKVYAPSGGLKHLELGTLAFATLLGDHRPGNLGDLLDHLGERTHRDLARLPWYAVGADRPWEVVPGTCTVGELAVARNMLRTTMHAAGVELLDLGCAVVFEDRFNRMVAATRSKAAMSFTFVAQHLLAIWERAGHLHPQVVVDRQSGRSHYRELLALSFPEAQLAILAEDDQRSAYRITGRHVLAGEGRPGQMTVSFEVQADGQHFPVALASMTAKYVRERLMERFNGWFTQRVPGVKPTAGYALDAQRFWREIQPHLPKLGIAPDALKRER